MATSKDFKIGDKVKLLAGGPVMAVEKVFTHFSEDRPTVRCQWFAGAKLQQGSFDPDTLVFAEDEEAK